MNVPRVTLYISVFVASIGLGMYTYFIPLFAQSFRATFLDLGFVGGANALTYAATPILVGFFADRFNRAYVFTLGVALNILSTVSLIFAGSVTDIVLLRLFGGFAYGFFWPTAEVLVTDLAPRNKRVREMGRYSVAWGSGLLIGPLLGGLVLQGLGFIRLFEIASSLIAIAFVVELVWLVPKYQSREKVLQTFSGSMTTMRRLTPWYLLAMCYGIVFGAIVAIFPGYANLIGVTPGLIGTLFAAMGVTRIVVFATSERFLRAGETKALAVASAFLTLATLLIVVYPSYLGFLAAMMIIGSCVGVIFPLTISLISRHFPDKKLGLAIGSYEAIWGAGFAVGPVMAGIIAVVVNPSSSFLFTSIFGVMMILFAVLGRSRSIRVRK